VDWADHLLNFLALLLWLGFRGIGVGGRAVPVRSGVAARFACGLALVGLLLGRAWFYWRMGPDQRWIPWLNLGITRIPFNSLMLDRMVGYSLCSFAVWWGTFHCFLNVLSMLTNSRRNSDPWAAWVAAQLGPFSRLPAVFKPLLPWGALTWGWLVARPHLVAIGVMLPPHQPEREWQQGLVLGATTLLAGATLLAPILLLHFTSLMAHLGSGKWLGFAELVATRASRPISWLPLTVGGVDLAPLLLAVGLLVGNWFAISGLGRLFQWLEIS
jgi:hypothetical protein